MKLRFLPLWLGATALLALSACNVNVQEGNATGAPGMPLDSNTTIVTHSETHSETHAGFEIKGDAHSETHSTTHTTTRAVKTLSLGQQVAQWTLEIFPDYKVVEMDPMEAYPKFKTAQETTFSRIRMKIPISNAYGKAIYPRLLLKAYRFANEQVLALEVEAWLNTLGSATHDIQLGQNVNSVKSPPLLCAVVGNDFFLVQAACVYEGKEWTATEQLFFATLNGQGASYAWKVKCDGGELVYITGGSTN
jgi:hypothetical protein